MLPIVVVNLFGRFALFEHDLVKSQICTSADVRSFRCKPPSFSRVSDVTLHHIANVCECKIEALVWMHGQRQRQMQGTEKCSSIWWHDHIDEDTKPQPWKCNGTGLREPLQQSCGENQGRLQKKTGPAYETSCLYVLIGALGRHAVSGCACVFKMCFEIPCNGELRCRQ